MRGSRRPRPAEAPAPPASLFALGNETDADSGFLTRLDGDGRVHRCEAVAHEADRVCAGHDRVRDAGLLREVHAIDRNVGPGTDPDEQYTPATGCGPRGRGRGWRLGPRRGRGRGLAPGRFGIRLRLSDLRGPTRLAVSGRGGR